MNENNMPYDPLTILGALSVVWSFPVNPAAIPVVNGCRKQDYAVLIVVGLPATH
jgi:hypothetical protein